MIWRYVPTSAAYYRSGATRPVTQAALREVRDALADGVSADIRAINHAIAVIEAYESEIRRARIAFCTVGLFDQDGSVEDGPTLAELGFCQGSIYQDALATIKNIARISF